MSRTANVLVFPSSMEESRIFVSRDAKRTSKYVGASSLSYDVSKKYFDEWVQLPYITDPDFVERLSFVLQEFNITRIFTPHHVVEYHLREIVSRLRPDVELISNADDSNTTENKDDTDWHSEYLSITNSIARARRHILKKIEVEASTATALKIRGESSPIKLLSLCAIATSAPNGDIVEIGSLRGRSAFLLGWLARRYELGNVLCIDPWNNALARQHEAPDLVNEVLENAVDFSKIFREFLDNLIPYFHKTFNYLRTSSEEGHSLYTRTRTVHTDEFGTTDYAGRIAILHIDGNHDYEQVNKDLHLWLPLLKPGGWLVLDDYNWCFGDGPKRCGDFLLKNGRDEIEYAFVIGDALFVRMK